MAIRRLIIGNKDVFFKERITGSVWKSPTGKTGLTLQACHCPCKIFHWNTLKSHVQFTFWILQKFCKW